jgi:hypothetical protein
VNTEIKFKKKTKQKSLGKCEHPRSRLYDPVMEPWMQRQGSTLTCKRMKIITLIKLINYILIKKHRLMLSIHIDNIFHFPCSHSFRTITVALSYHVTKGPAMGSMDNKFSGWPQATETLGKMPLANAS